MILLNPAIWIKSTEMVQIKLIKYVEYFFIQHNSEIYMEKIVESLLNYHIVFVNCAKENATITTILSNVIIQVLTLKFNESTIGKLIECLNLSYIQQFPNSCRGIYEVLRIILDLLFTCNFLQKM